MQRRVDRVEFLDLLTVRRTIALTFDPRRFAPSARSCCARPADPKLVPLGWFAPWGNAGAVLLDADQRSIPYLTAQESDKCVRAQLAERLKPFGIDETRLDRVLEHRFDPGLPGVGCRTCKAIECDKGRRELMCEKWGCRSVMELFDELFAHPDRNEDATFELVRLLLAWQTNFVLYACLDASDVPGDRVTLQLSYDEELLEWEPPWERHRRTLGRGRGDLSGGEARACRELISRGGPFASDFDALLPRGLDRLLARCRFGPLRRLGRRGLLGVVWHVAWHQASGVAIPDQHVDVVLPSELAVARMRMLRTFYDESGVKHVATVADQVGSRATIVAPKPSGGLPPRHWSPTLFSIAIVPRSPASWYGGAAAALLTGLALLVVGWQWLDTAVEHLDAAVAVLVFAPTLVSTVLAVRAASEIADALTTRVRRLISAVAVLAVVCAVGLVVQPEPERSEEARRAMPDPAALQKLWVLAGVALVIVFVVLFGGGWRIRRLLARGRRPSPRYLDEKQTATGEVLNPPRYLHIPPPDRWLKADEGDLVAWGWMNGLPTAPMSPIDERFWNRPDCNRISLLRWVQEAIGYRNPAN